MTEKTKYLARLHADHGDFELLYLKDYDPETKKAKAGWRRWKRYSEAKLDEQKEANLRSIFKHEIVLDVEEPERIDEIIEHLNSADVNFIAFKTGSRGYHVHMVFDELRDFDDDQAELVKEKIIKRFGCDVSKKSKRNMIALEYEPHFKTGKKKEPVEIVTGKKHDFGLFFAGAVKLADAIDSDPKLRELFAGEWEKWGFPSRSEAEQSVCGILASRGFAEREILHAMRRCKIGKWQEAHPSYRKLTARKAVKYAEEHPADFIDITESPLKFWEEYGEPEPISWLVPGYIPRRGVCVLSGPTGCGKSFIAQEMIRAIANGAKLFGEIDMEAGKAILVDQENPYPELHKRIEELGGVPEKTLLVWNPEKNFDVRNTNAVAALKEAIEKLDPCLVIFDTLRRVYSGDENDSKEINMVYKKLLQPISRDRCCLLISHNRKSSKGTPAEKIEEIRGTGDITGMATSVLGIDQNKDGSINVEPLKLRTDKLSETFTVRIRDDDGKLWFEYLDSPEKIKNDSMIGMKINRWLLHNKRVGDSIKAKEFVEYAEQKHGLDRRRTYDGIYFLLRKGVLKRDESNYGHYVYENDMDTIDSFTT